MALGQRGKALVLQEESVAWYARPIDQLEGGALSITSFFRPLIVALLLSECGLQAQPLVETYKRQEELRHRVADICYSQFENSQYHPAGGSAEDVRYMISAKGVQAIKAFVIPARSGGSYKCDRGSYEQPMLLGRTYTSRNLRVIPSKQAAACRSLRYLSAKLSACDVVRGNKLNINCFLLMAL